MKYTFFFCAALLLWSLTSCSNSTSHELIPAPTITTTSTARLIRHSSQSNSYFEIKAKFIDFEMGDVSHYLFEDEQGTIWDFTDCFAQEFQFEQALPEEKQTDFNRGWTSNKMLQGHWFLLECVTDEQSLYPQGTDESTHVIKHATFIY